MHSYFKYDTMFASDLYGIYNGSPIVSITCAFICRADELYLHKSIKEHIVGIRRRFDVDFQSKSGRDVDLPIINVVSTSPCRRFNDVRNRRCFDVESTSILRRQISRRFTKKYRRCFILDLNLYSSGHSNWLGSSTQILQH